MKWFLFALFFLLIDLLVFWSGRKSFGIQFSKWLRWTLGIIYWMIPASIGFITIYLFRHVSYPVLPQYWDLIELAMGIFVLFYIGKIIYLLFAIPLEFIGIYIRKNRSVYLQIHKIVSTFALILVIVHLLAATYGILFGRFDFQVRKEVVQSINVPKAFDGFKILQFSDLHIGSFIGHEDRLKQAFKLITDQDVDMVVFTGDLVNIQSNEAMHFLTELKQLSSENKLFAVLGNHDYMGHSAHPETTNKLRDEVIQIYRQTDTHLLLNESQYIHYNGDSILLVGVENWGIPPFPPYGDFDKALGGKNTDSIFTVLLSHDPSHWENKIVHRAKVDLTLSGHTHGMQYALKLGGLKISPVSLKYRYWSGIYQVGNQFLNVSTGLGFIAFPGRVGVPPEVCVIELKSLE